MVLAPLVLCLVVGVTGVVYPELLSQLMAGEEPAEPTKGGPINGLAKLLKIKS